MNELDYNPSTDLLVCDCEPMVQLFHPDGKWLRSDDDKKERYYQCPKCGKAWNVEKHCKILEAEDK